MSLFDWSLVLAAIGLIGLWLAVKRPILGLSMAVIAQPLWTAYAIYTQQWGFILSALAYVVVYGRLLWKERERMGYNARDKERLAIWLAWKLPRSVAERAFYRVVAHATTGQWGNTVVPELTAMDAATRWTIPHEPVTLGGAIYMFPEALTEEEAEELKRKFMEPHPDRVTVLSNEGVVITPRDDADIAEELKHQFTAPAE